MRKARKPSSRRWRKPRARPRRRAKKRKSQSRQRRNNHCFRLAVLLLISRTGLEGSHEFSTGSPVGIFQRACRSEFWWWQLFLLLAGIVAAVLDLFANSRRLWRLAARDLVLARHHYSRSRRHGAQAPRYRVQVAGGFCSV